MSTQWSARLSARNVRVDGGLTADAQALNRLRRLFDQAPGLMAILRGPAHVFETANVAFMRLIGPRDIIGKNVRKALPEIEGQGFFELLDKVYATGEPFVGQGMPARLRRTPDRPDQARFVDFIYQPIVEDDGTVSGIFIEGHDVTERIQAQHEMAALLGELQALYDATPVGMCVFDAEGRYKRVNAHLAEINGISAKDHIGRTFRDIVPDISDTVGALHRRVMETGEPQHIEISGETKARPGEIRTWESYWVPLRDQSGTVVGVNVVAEEVTERKRQEKAIAALLAEKEEMARRSEVMAREMSHRLLNSLYAVEGLFALQTRRMTQNDPALSVIQGARQRVHAMALAHRFIYQPERGDAARVEVGAYLRALVDELAPAFAEGKCDVTADVEEGVEMEATLATGIGMLTTELFINACKYAFNQGRRGSLRVSFGSEGAGYRLAVEDDGSGLPDGFDSEASTGLGMRLVQSFTRQLSGQLHIEPLNPGTRFAIAFPGRPDSPLLL